jgi:inhibitor of KinA
VEIPVCYGGDFGPDLMELAAMHSIPPDRVVQIHSAASYLVYFIGFVPGFAYLGGLPAELATPRLQTPRKRVPRGSVAIGGTHTGVYPFETPGGWRLIGRTPLEIFDPRSAELSRLRIGDIVRFQPIDEDQFNALRCQ